MMLAPWVLLPVILALRGGPRPQARAVRVLAARSALALALMGAVNAVATLTGCLPAVIWWACHRPNRLWLRFTAWWALCAVLAVTWWVVALVMLGRISPPFLDFIESSGVTTQWMSLTEMLRGTDSWTPFVAPDATAGASLVTGHGCGAGDDAGRRGGPGRVGDAHDACPRQADDDPADRCRAAGRRICRRPRIASRPSGSDVPGRGRHPAAQRAQAGAADPAAAGARASRICSAASPLPGSVPRREWVHAFAHPETRQAGRRRHRGAGRVGRRHVAGLDGPAHPAWRLRRDPAVLARHGRLARRTQRGSPRAGAGRARRPVRHPGVGHPATTNRCRCSATARGVCATRFR